MTGQQTKDNTHKTTDKDTQGNTNIQTATEKGQQKHTKANRQRTTTSEGQQLTDNRQRTTRTPSTRQPTKDNRERTPTKARQTKVNIQGTPDK